MCNEEWKDIPDYEGYYQVSSHGRIRSLDRMRRNNGDSISFCKGRDLKLGANSGTGYLCVGLSRDGVCKTRDVHRIVAEVFVPNVDDKPYVDHIDCDKHNNRADNLRWVTQKENIHHGIEVGNIDLSKKTKYLSDPIARLACVMSTRHPVVRSDGKKFDSVTEAADYTGCSRRAITKVLNGDNKTCFGYTFSYLDEEML